MFLSMALTSLSGLQLLNKNSNLHINGIVYSGITLNDICTFHDGLHVFMTCLCWDTGSTTSLTATNLRLCPCMLSEEGQDTVNHPLQVSSYCQELSSQAKVKTCVYCLWCFPDATSLFFKYVTIQGLFIASGIRI